MRILQITSAVVCGQHNLGKWFCFDTGSDCENKPIHRYLQKDGTWGLNASYFDTQNEITELLKLGHQPDFSLSKDERLSRQMEDWQQDYTDEDESYSGEF